MVHKYLIIPDNESKIQALIYIFMALLTMPFHLRIMQIFHHMFFFLYFLLIFDRLINLHSLNFIKTRKILKNLAYLKILNLDILIAIVLKAYIDILFNFICE